MESNTTEQDLSRDELLLEEPHFDEEATVLSARPVVPLEVVEAKTRWGRRLLIGSAIMAALLIGVFAASFIDKFRGEPQARSVTATDDSSRQSQLSVEGGALGVESQEPVPVVESLEPEPPALDNKESDERTVVNTVPATPPGSISRDPSPRNAPKLVKTRNQDEGQDGLLEEPIPDQRQLDMEIRRAERREERRAARREERQAEKREERRPRRVEKEAKHQGGDRDARSTDDLLRIREIFEGRPKP